MPDAPGWTYAYSDALSMRYAYRDTPQGPEVMTEDKTRYSASEVKVLADAGESISLAIHLVKRAFNGEVVSTAMPHWTPPNSAPDAATSRPPAPKPLHK